MVDAVTAYLVNPFIAAAIGVVLGIVFGQKIKDFVTGVPSEFRSAMSSVETKAKADVSAAVADVFAKIVPATAKPVAPVAPAAPAAPTPEAPVAH